MTPSNWNKDRDPVNTLRSIAGIANQLEEHISDAMGVVRIAVKESSDAVMDTRMGALYLIWYQLEQIQKAHAQIVNLLRIRKEMRKGVCHDHSHDSRGCRNFHA